MKVDLKKKQAKLGYIHSVDVGVKFGNIFGKDTKWPLRTFYTMVNKNERKFALEKNRMEHLD